MPFQEPFLFLLLLRRLLRILQRRQPPWGSWSIISATHAGAQGHVIHTLIVIWAVAVINNPPGASPVLIMIWVLGATVVARDGIAGVASAGIVLIIGRVVVASDGVSSASSPVVHSNTVVQAAVCKPVIGFVDGSQGGAWAGVGDGWARPLLGQFLLLHAPGNTSNSKMGKRTSQRTNVWCELTVKSAYCRRKGENAFCHAMPETTSTASIRKRGKEEGKNAQEATHEYFFKSDATYQHADWNSPFQSNGQAVILAYVKKQQQWKSWNNIYLHALCTFDKDGPRTMQQCMQMDLFPSPPPPPPPPPPHPRCFSSKEQQSVCSQRLKTESFLSQTELSCSAKKRKHSFSTLLCVFSYAVAMWQTHHNTSTVFSAMQRPCDKHTTTLQQCFQLCSGHVTNTSQHFNSVLAMQQPRDKHTTALQQCFSYAVSMWQTHHNTSTVFFSYAVSMWQTHHNTSTVFSAMQCLCDKHTTTLQQCFQLCSVYVTNTSQHFNSVLAMQCLCNKHTVPFNQTWHNWVF